MKKKFVLIVFLVFFIGKWELFSQNNKDVRFSKMINSLNNWNMKSAVDELMEISKSSNLADEGFFYFFKASITLYTYIQVDSTQDNNALNYIDSSVKYFERAIIAGTMIDIPELYIKNPQQGLDSCAEIIGKRAKRYFLNDDLLKAMTHYEKIIDFKPDASNFLNAALTAMKLTSYKKAEKYFNQSLELNPNNEKAWIGLTETYKRTNDTVNAINTAIKSLLHDTINHNLIVNMYNIAVYSKKEMALNQAIQRLEYANSDSKYSLLLANLFFLKKDFQKAELYYLSFTGTQNEDNGCELLIKFYYNWYLNLYATNLLESVKGNSIKYSSFMVYQTSFIHSKIKKCLSSQANNFQLKGIVDFLNSEFKL